MHLFLNLTTRTKLFFGFGLMLLLLAGVVATAHRAITAMLVSQQKLYSTDFADAIDLMTLRSKENGARASLFTMMLQSKRDEQEIWHKDIKERNQDIDKLLQQLLARQRDDQEFHAKLKELKAARDTYSHTRDEQTIPLIYAGKFNEAKDMALGLQYERYLKIRALADVLGDDAEARAKAAVAKSGQKADESARTFAIIGITALLLGIAMTLLLTRFIANPLKAVSELASRISAGDLTTNVPHSHRADEVGILFQSFRNMVESLRKLTTEIREGVSVLTASSAEILATTIQTASGAAETATAVNETTATVEEVKQTVEISNQKAKQVSDTAQKTVQVSQSGRQAVEKMIGSMDRIREQTFSTAESIVKLSEQSQAVSEIISTVNDLAEQSNLLAVNASIEAAKAGDQGKGFVVVAQEIKNLAEQSKQATAQVRMILGNIQKATEAAVMATDLNGKTVEAGTQQSDIADDSIRMLTESIEEAAQAALQIAATSQQQMVGMNQVALAMENIKQASMQNMAGTKQAETAANNLHEIGFKLKQMVEQYRI